MISAFHHSETATQADSPKIDRDRPGNTASLKMKNLMFPNTHSPTPHQQQCMNIYIIWDHLQAGAAPAAFVFPNSSGKLFLFDVIWNGWGSSLQVNFTYFYPLYAEHVLDNRYWQEFKKKRCLTLMLILDISNVKLRVYSWSNIKSEFKVYEPVHRKYIPKYIQQYAKLHNLFISGKCSTCFGWYLHPLSGAHTTVSTASGICQTVTVTCRDSSR
jgi:hypothetical protein